jgi:hypothetical protein
VWHELTFYNTDGKSAMDIEVALAGDTAEGALGLNPDKDYYVYDFWNDAFVGRIAGGGKLSQQLRPAEARMMSVHEATDHPQFIATNRHVMQGYIDLIQTEWLPGRNLLRGVSKITGGDSYVVTIAANGYTPQSAAANDPGTQVRLERVDSTLVKLTLTRAETAVVEWTVRF